MSRMTGLAAILGVAMLMAVIAACGSDKVDTGDGPTGIAQALKAAEGSKVTVSGHLIAGRDGNTRLCSLLAESLPPQCGGDRISLLGFDASSVPNSKTPQRPSDIPTVRWTDSLITVTGIKRIDGLADVQLSIETPTTPDVQPGSASMGMIAPNLRLTFDGVEYTGVEILGAATPNGQIVCCGTQINMDDMAIVGTGIWHNLNGDSTKQVYRPKIDGTADVYTFHSSQTVSTPEEEADTTPATWTRWTAK